MKGRIITDIGQVSVDTDVIAKYAGMAAVECFGVLQWQNVQSVKKELTLVFRCLIHIEDQIKCGNPTLRK